MASSNEQDVYERLSRHLLTASQLKRFGYPCSDPKHPGRILAPEGELFDRRKLLPMSSGWRTCKRCNESYNVDEDGMQVESETCVYHDSWWTRSNCYSCCRQSNRTARGCKSNPYHVQRGVMLLPNYQGFHETQPRIEYDPNRHGVYAVDTEMCYTPAGLELTRVTIVNYKQDIVYDKLVKPARPILDHNTSSSGIKPGDLDHVTTRLVDVQRDLLQLFSSKSILVGHSIEYDLKALKLVHNTIVDTSILFPHERGLPLKKGLKTLVSEKLGQSIQGDVGHDSFEDARAALRLAYHKVGVSI